MSNVRRFLRWTVAGVGTLLMVFAVAHMDRTLRTQTVSEPGFTSVSTEVWLDMPFLLVVGFGLIALAVVGRRGGKGQD